MDWMRGVAPFITAFRNSTKGAVNSAGIVDNEMQKSMAVPMTCNRRIVGARPTFRAILGAIWAEAAIAAQIASCRAATPEGEKPKSRTKKSGQYLNVIPLPIAVTRLENSTRTATSQRCRGAAARKSGVCPPPPLEVAAATAAGPTLRSECRMRQTNTTKGTNSNSPEQRTQCSSEVVQRVVLVASMSTNCRAGPLASPALAAVCMWLRAFILWSPASVISDSKAGKSPKRHWLCRLEATAPAKIRGTESLGMPASRSREAAAPTAALHRRTNGLGQRSAAQPRGKASARDASPRADSKEPTKVLEPRSTKRYASNNAPKTIAVIVWLRYCANTATRTPRGQSRKNPELRVTVAATSSVCSCGAPGPAAGSPFPASSMAGSLAPPLAGPGPSVGLGE
mmetsp:Transcript_83329/g.258774  ORF Transcript_83329/g.258774 Transcript_83329/m.258774 type:complete len:397 (-) Transcript_83329:48-1238(-)